MNNSQKGSIKIVLLSITFLIIGAGAYLYFVNGLTVKSLSQSIKAGQILNSARKSEVTTPPYGYLVPNNVPSDFTLSGSRFTLNSTHFSYKSEKKMDFGNFTYYLNFSEKQGETFDGYVKRQTESEVQDVKIVKDFVYNGTNGAVLGEYSSSGRLNGTYYLAYDHNGRLVNIHTTKGEDLTPDHLIELLKSMTVAK